MSTERKQEGYNREVFGNLDNLTQEVKSKEGWDKLHQKDNAPKGSSKELANLGGFPTPGDKNSVLIISFYGISCMGKSELVRMIIERAKADGIHTQKVCKDAVSKVLVDEFSKANPEVPYENIFMTIFPEIRQAFSDGVFACVDNLKPGCNIILVDDAIPDAAILQRLVSNSTAPNYQKKLMSLYPKVPIHKRVQDFPFSNQFILDMCFRAVERTEHETMIYDDAKKVQIILSFIRLFHGIPEIPEKYQLETKLHEFVPLEFHQEPERDDQEMPELIQKTYTQIHKCFESMGPVFETPFVTGREEVARLVLLILEIQKSENTDSRSFLRYGKKEDWLQFYCNAKKTHFGILN